MKLVVIASRIPFPLDKGDKLRLFHQLESLNKHFEICLICLTDQKATELPQSLVEITKEIHVIQLSKWRMLFNLAGTVFTQTPFQVAYFFQRKAKQRVDKIINQFQPQHIFCQLIRTAPYSIDLFNIHKSIDFMDALSKAAERRFNTSRGISKLFWREEWMRTKNYELKCHLYFQNHFIISKNDLSFINFPPSPETIVLPNGAPENELALSESAKNTDVLFVGNMSYPPNQKAAEHLYEIHLQLSSDISFQIAGVNPSVKLLKYSSHSFNVTGFVSNINQCYVSAKIFVAPMTIGAGMQNKILEAMAARLPVITTSLAAKAFQNIEESAMIIEDDLAKYPAIIKDYLSSESKRINDGSMNLNYVKKFYDWDTVNDILIQRIKK
ncbi:MAG: glycosyltransferase [Bacteroidota bacterium]|jgi:glycosyltransferase involved in cell wall biosynthesis